MTRDDRLWRRQVAAILRLELRKILLGKRSFPLYLLALMPVGLLSLRAVAVAKGWARTSVLEADGLYAGLYQGFVLRFVVFFGCAWVFTNLFRGEVLDRSLHFYFLCPVRRDVLVAAKFVAGLAAAATVLVASTLAAYTLLLLPHGTPGVERLLLDPGLPRALQYGAITALACLGYGAVFLAAGLLVRNPMIPAVVLLLWESINFLLPPVLKKLSVIHYLTSLCPVTVSEGPFAILADPTPAWISGPGLLVLTALVLWWASRRIRSTEISYGVD